MKESDNFISQHNMIPRKAEAFYWLFDWERFTHVKAISKSPPWASETSIEHLFERKHTIRSNLNSDFKTVVRADTYPR